MQWQGVLPGVGELKKFLILAAALFVLPRISFGWSFGSGGGVDYSRDAGNSFYCANLAGSPVTTAAGLSATAPALVLVNPWGSGKLLTILNVNIDVTASPAAAAGFMLAYSTGGTNVGVSVAFSSGGIVAFSTNTLVTPMRLQTVVNSSTTQVGLTTGQCYGGIGTVLPSKPQAFRYLGGTTGASAIGGVLLTDETYGQVVMPPGSIVSLQATSAAAVIADFVWREDAL